MSYEPVYVEENFNVSKQSPIREFFILIGSLFGIGLAIYFILGLFVDAAVMHMSPETEMRLGRMYNRAYDTPDTSQSAIKLSGMLDDLLQYHPPEDRDYRVSVVESEVVNAVAVPGHRIVFYQGLLNQVESENELAFILAHELGHFAHRDHLRGLGRSLVLVVMSAALFGNDNPATNLLMQTLSGARMKYSQSQETAADLYALDLLNRAYGHVAGSVDFFQRLDEKSKHSKLMYYFATHPHPSDRVSRLNRAIEEHGYVIGEKTPVSFE